MKIGYELTIEQTQKLSMTPELIQAIQILQYNNQELNEYIDKELLENPILESEYHKESDTEIDIDSLRDQLIQADENVEAYKQWESHSTSDEYSYENFVAFNYTLTEFLIEQLHFSSLKGQDAEIGRYIIENIDDNGYLSMSLEEICSVLDVDLDSCERVLDLIHTFEPSGVGARDLNECLIIQLASLGELTDEIEFIISNRLKDLADNKYALISKEVGISLTEVQGIADLIKTLEPKPGRGFDSDNSIKYILPDIYVEETNGEYIVGANHAIVQFQNDFFTKGERFLKPLTLKQIAETVGVHESTVSRAINGKYMQCPRGVFELKYFFTGGILNEDGSGVSSNSIKSMIKEFVDAEDDKKPLSDSKISEMLHEKGIDISRRTVAKYRDDIGILPSSKRRRF